MNGGNGSGMNDREKIIECYKGMYEGMVHKDTDLLKNYLDDSYVLVHMTGVKMNLQEYFDALLDGTLNYYKYRHENISVEIDGNNAKAIGDTRVEAAVYGGSKHVWPLRLKCEFKKKGDQWMMTRSVASTY